MPTTAQVCVPDIGDLSDVAVIEINVSPGDIVAEGDTLVVVESDKATLEIPADRNISRNSRTCFILYNSALTLESVDYPAPLKTLANACESIIHQLIPAPTGHSAKVKVQDSAQPRTP